MMRWINVNSNYGVAETRTSAGVLSYVQDVEIHHGEIESLFGIETICLKPGLKMIIVNHDNPHGFRMHYEIDQPPVSLSFNLSMGHCCTITRGDKKGAVLQRSPGERLLTYLPGSSGIVEIPKKNPVRGVSIHFSMQMFRELFQDTPSVFLNSMHPERSIYQKSDMNRDSAIVLKQIMDCPYKGRLRHVFLEAKAMELAVNALAGTYRAHGQEQQELSPGDLERLREAYEILRSCMEEPPGLNDLCRRVGLNRNKLNLGFRQLYGGTVFKVLRDLRLSRAWSLLLHTDLSLVDIAFSVGYNNQSNFTTAFHRQWGKTPKSVRQNHIPPEFKTLLL